MSDTDVRAPSPADLLAEQESSGLTIAAFSRERGISAWKLCAARRRERKDRGLARSRFAAVTVLDTRSSPGSFELDLVGGRRLVIQSGFDADELARLLAVLERC